MLFKAKKSIILLTQKLNIERVKFIIFETEEEWKSKMRDNGIKPIQRKKTGIDKTKP